MESSWTKCRALGRVETYLCGSTGLRRPRRRMTTHPKIYLFDAGLFHSLRTTGPFDRPEELAGAALEGLVAQHLRAWIAYSNRDDTLSFWRTRTGNEVDFVLYGESGLSPSKKSSVPFTRGTSADSGRSRRTIRSRPPCCSTAARAASRSAACSACHASRFSAPSPRSVLSRKPSHPRLKSDVAAAGSPSACLLVAQVLSDTVAQEFQFRAQSIQ